MCEGNYGLEAVLGLSDGKMWPAVAGQNGLCQSAPCPAAPRPALGCYLGRRTADAQHDGKARRRPAPTPTPPASHSTHCTHLPSPTWEEGLPVLEVVGRPGGTQHTGGLHQALDVRVLVVILCCALCEALQHPAGGPEQAGAGNAGEDEGAGGDGGVGGSGGWVGCCRAGQAAGQAGCWQLVMQSPQLLSMLVLVSCPLHCPRRHQPQYGNKYSTGQHSALPADVARGAEEPPVDAQPSVPLEPLQYHWQAGGPIPDDQVLVSIPEACSGRPAAAALLSRPG